MDSNAVSFWVLMPFMFSSALFTSLICMTCDLVVVGDNLILVENPVLLLNDDVWYYSFAFEQFMIWSATCTVKII